MTLHHRDRRGAAQHRPVTEIAPQQGCLCVNRSPIRYGFRASAKATWCTDALLNVYDSYFKCLSGLQYHLILKQTNLRRRPQPYPLVAWFA